MHLGAVRLLTSNSPISGWSNTSPTQRAAAVAAQRMHARRAAEKCHHGIQGRRRHLHHAPSSHDWCISLHVCALTSLAHLAHFDGAEDELVELFPLQCMLSQGKSETLQVGSLKVRTCSYASSCARYCRISSLSASVALQWPSFLTACDRISRDKWMKALSSLLALQLCGQAIKATSLPASVPTNQGMDSSAYI